MRVLRREVAGDGDRAGPLPLDRRQLPALERADAGRREVAGDAVDAGAVGAVRRQVDLDHRVVEPGEGRVGLADGGVGREVQDAVVVVRQAELGARAQHAAALDAADHAHRQGDVLARHVGAGGREHGLHAGPRVRRAADHLHGRALAGVDSADPQPVGVRVLLGGEHGGDAVGGERLRLVLDALDLQPDAGQRLDDHVEGSVGVEVVLEPGEGEFHGAKPLGSGEPGLRDAEGGRARRRASPGATRPARHRRRSGCAQPVRPPTRLGMSRGRKP